jgi:Na+/H+ antiporter NhaD/arsenite permease-like protein
MGVVLLILFALTVALNDPIVHILSRMLGIDIDPHSFLTFIPYIYIVFSMFIAVPLEKISILVSRAVEWSSIVFFIMLFMLGYSLLHTGAMPKLAYALSTISTSPLALLTLMVISSATLSAVLDNLSVIVAFTPIAMLFVNAELISSIIFFALLFGGVFGGNYTPIGSTANIVALSMAEKEKVKLSWRRWLSIALITTTTQIAIAVLWVIFNQVML